MKKEKTPEVISTNSLNYLYEFGVFQSFMDFRTYIFILKNYFGITESSSSEMGERVVFFPIK